MTNMAAGLPVKTLDNLRTHFLEDKKSHLALNSCVKYGPEEILHCRKNNERVSHIFNHKVGDQPLVKVGIVVAPYYTVVYDIK